MAMAYPNTPLWSIKRRVECIKSIGPPITTQERDLLLDTVLPAICNCPLSSIPSMPEIIKEK